MLASDHVSRLTCRLTGRAVAAAAAVAAQHELVDKVDNGAGRLVGVQLGKHVALVAAGLRRPPRNKGKQSRGGGGRLAAVAFFNGPTAVLGIEATVGNLTGGKVFTEEQPTGLVRQGDTLAWKLIFGENKLFIVIHSMTFDFQVAFLSMHE